MKAIKPEYLLNKTLIDNKGITFSITTLRNLFNTSKEFQELLTEDDLSPTDKMDIKPLFYLFFNLEAQALAKYLLNYK